MTFSVMSVLQGLRLAVVRKTGTASEGLVRYWPGAQWRKGPSPSTWPSYAVSKLELLGFCVAQGGFWVLSAWMLA